MGDDGKTRLYWEKWRNTGPVLRVHEQYGRYALCSQGGQFFIMRGYDEDDPMETARGCRAFTHSFWLAVVARAHANGETR